MDKIIARADCLVRAGRNLNGLLPGRHAQGFRGQDTEDEFLCRPHVFGEEDAVHISAFLEYDPHRVLRYIDDVPDQTGIFF